MFIFGSSLLVLRCATALKSSLEVTSSWMSLRVIRQTTWRSPDAWTPADPGARRAVSRGSAIRGPGVTSSGPWTRALRSASPPPAGEGGWHGALLPAQGHGDVSRHPVRPVDDLDAQLVAAGTKIRVP